MNTLFNEREIQRNSDIYGQNNTVDLFKNFQG